MLSSPHEFKGGLEAVTKSICKDTSRRDSALNNVMDGLNEGRYRTMFEESRVSVTQLNPYLPYLQQFAWSVIGLRQTGGGHERSADWRAYEERKLCGRFAASPPHFRRILCLKGAANARRQFRISERERQIDVVVPLSRCFTEEEGKRKRRRSDQRDGALSAKTSCQVSSPVALSSSYLVQGSRVVESSASSSFPFFNLA